MSYAWIFLDADNTILDYDRSEEEALQRTFEAFGVMFSKVFHEWYQQINQSHWRALEEGRIDRSTLRIRRFEELFLRVGLSLDALDFAQHYQEQLTQSAHPMPGAPELLQDLAQKYKLALLTNGSESIQKPRMERSGLHDFFEFMVMSGEQGKPKPHPEFFFRATAMAGGPSPDEVLMVGDNWHADILGAVACGLHTCWYNPVQLPFPSVDRPTYSVQSLRELQDILS